MATRYTSTGLRFAFSFGGQWIGWAVLTLDDSDDNPRATGLVDCGVRLFDDSRNPLDGAPLSEQRRGPRAARRRRDRFVRRRQRLMHMLIGFGLMPAEPKARAQMAAIDPYRLRAEALDRPISAHEIGRALLHLNQRRGFKSNRKVDRDDRDEPGKIAAGSDRLIEHMASSGARTFGEFLWTRHRGPDGHSSPRHRQSVRIRREGDGRDARFAFYPTRSMLEDEFDAIMAAQRPHHQGLLTDERMALLRAEIFFQRRMKALRRGKCALIPAESRLPRSLPSVEACTIYRTVNRLRFRVERRGQTRLTGPQRDEIAALLLRGRNVTPAMLRKITGRSSDGPYPSAIGDVTRLKTCVAETARRLAADDAFGPTWHDFSLIEKDAIVQKLVGDDDEGALCAWLTEIHGVSPSAARTITQLSFPPGSARLGATATAAVLTQLMAADVPTYADAVQRAGAARGETWHHANLDTPQPQAYLPYYAQVLDRHVLPGTHAGGDDPLEALHGKIANPTLHRGFRQLQKLVNALIRRHGRPAQIIVEIARDLKSGGKTRGHRRDTNAKLRGLHQSHRSVLEAQLIPNTAEARLRVRLHNEQAQAGGGIALCPYTLQPIAREQLFSERVVIDHILPYSRTLDDTPANQVVCFREASTTKRKLTPHESFGGTPIWGAIEANGQLLPANKRWRFTEDAITHFESDAHDVSTRHLNEAHYISRLTRAYLTVVAHPGAVHVSTGQLTALLRRRWGLAAILKDREAEDAPSRQIRDDHRHHAINAIIIGAIDQPLLHDIARRADQFEREGRDWRISDAAPREPFHGLMDAATRLVRNMIVSRKPEHGKGGALHQETAYGLVRDDVEAAAIGTLVTRKPLTALSPEDVDRIRDRGLRAAVQAATAPFRDDQGKLRNERSFKAALKTFSETRGLKGREQGVRRVRVGKTQKEIALIRDRHTGTVYKALIAGENHHLDIVQMRDGTWQGFAATRFEVNQKGWRPVWERERLGGKLVMRVHKGDVIALEDKGCARYMCVHRLSPSNNVIYLAEHFEGGVLRQRHHDTTDSFRWDFASIRILKDRRARLVHIDILGNVFNRPSNVEPAPHS